MQLACVEIRWFLAQADHELLKFPFKHGFQVVNKLVPDDLLVAFRDFLSLKHVSDFRWRKDIFVINA